MGFLWLPWWCCWWCFHKGRMSRRQIGDYFSNFKIPPSGVRVMMRRGKRYDLEFWNGIGVFCWAAFKTLYTCISRKALTLEKNSKIQVVCIFTLLENSANISKNWVWRDLYKRYPLLIRGINLVWAQPKINMFPYICTCMMNEI